MHTFAEATLARMRGAGNLPREEDGHWHVGCRYQVTRPIVLREGRSNASKRVGRLVSGDVAIVLQQIGNRMEEGAKTSVTMLHLASRTSLATQSSWRQLWSHGWAHGWAHVEHLEKCTPDLDKRRLLGSWEIAGKYAVRRASFLQSGPELESDAVSDLAVGEELLLKDMALVVSGDEPTFRGQFVNSKGVQGWVSLEGRGLEPCLFTRNLYDALPGYYQLLEAWLEVEYPGGADLNPWTAGGLYRTLRSVTLYDDYDETTVRISDLYRGNKVFVQDKRDGTDTKGKQVVSLLVEVVRSHRSVEQVGIVGWIRARTSSGKAVLDWRDQLEAKKSGVLSRSVQFCYKSSARKRQPVISAASASSDRSGSVAGRTLYSSEASGQTRQQSMQLLAPPPPNLSTSSANGSSGEIPLDASP